MPTLTWVSAKDAARHYQTTFSLLKEMGAAGLIPTQTITGSKKKLYGVLDNVVEAQGDGLNYETSLKRKRDHMELDRGQMELEERRAALKEAPQRSQLALMTQGYELFKAIGPIDETEDIYFQDQIRSILRTLPL